jgi:hypothetical protein
MSKRLVGIVGAAALSAGFLLGPLAASASAQQSKSTLKDHCIVERLGHGLQITLCYVT